MPPRLTVALLSVIAFSPIVATAAGAEGACDAGVTEQGLVATYRPGVLLLRADPGDRSPALVAHWPTGDGVTDATLAARLEPADRGDIAGSGPWVAVPVRASVQWAALVGDTLREFAPTAEGEAALVVLQGDEFAFYVDADGVLRVHPHESKPAERRVRRVVDEAVFAERAAARLRASHPGCVHLLFAAGGDRDPSYVFFDAERRVSVLVAAPAGVPNGIGNFLRTASRVPETLILRGQAFGVLARPVSSTARLAWLAAQTVATLPPPLPVASGPATPVEARPPMDRDRWERRLDDLNLPLRSYARIEPLIDGDAFFTRLVQSIQDARTEVAIRLFIFDNDDYAIRLADLLKRRSREVRVRVLVDALGTLGAGEAAPPGAASHPAFNMARYLRDHSAVEVRETPNAWLVSDHTKTLVVDGRIAFLGGMNIGHEYRHDWHDMMVELEGPLVATLQRDFEVAWAYAGPWGDLAYLAAVSSGPSPSLPPGPGMVEVRPLYTRTLDAQVLRAQAEAMRRSKSRVWVEQPYLSDDGLVRELVEARSRGVDVRVVLPSSGDSRLMNSANLLAARTLVQGGVRVYVYPGMTHVKAALYDGWACLGSANFDKLSLRVNRETNVATADPAFVGRLERELFEVDFARSRELVAAPSVGWNAYLAAYLAGQL
jgi:cardiolipin synthase